MKFWLFHFLGWPAWIYLVLLVMGQKPQLSQLPMATLTWAAFWGFLLGLGHLMDWIQRRTP